MKISNILRPLLSSGKVINREDMIHECFRLINKWLPKVETRERLVNDPYLVKCILFSLPFVSKFLVTKIIETFVDCCYEYEIF